MNNPPDGAQQPAPQRPTLVPATTPAGPAAIPPTETERLHASDPPGAVSMALQERKNLREKARLRRWLGHVVVRRRPRPRIALKGLIAEQQVMDVERDPATTTYGEAVVHTAGANSAQREINKTQRRLSRHARRQDRLASRVCNLRHRAAAILASDRVRDPLAGHRPVENATALHTRLQTQVSEELADGHGEHQRLGRILRRAPAVVATCDAAILLYFMAGVLNVDWARPWGIPTLVAVVFAIFGTGVSFAILTLAGHRLRERKGPDNEIAWGMLDSTTYGVLAGSAIAAVALAVLMYVRVSQDVRDALGDTAIWISIPFAVVFAILSLLANLSVVVVHAFDGSALTARVDGLARATKRPLVQHRHHLKQAARLQHRIEKRTRAAEREMFTGITRAGRHLTTANHLVDAARAIHQGVGPIVAPAQDVNATEGVAAYRWPCEAPPVDQRGVRSTLNQIRHPQTNLGSDKFISKSGVTPVHQPRSDIA